ncbi:5-formyltetrahydrofolate cyclo-ligase [Shewanella sp. UCD-KL12]|uniref:5-formyltetrahydrofolate cyclo-ligase n=1 Tax=Shewanella sp. UCD-KL12 TaxID=1917163 RepID=UPI0021160E2A|nr:5-formyltetrahydrofolate cyclo-ligase [Shewanella sp. UCD-KL12]
MEPELLKHVTCSPSKAASESRKAIRHQIRSARRSLSEPEQAHFAEQASHAMLAEITKIKAKNVALYLTNDGELGTQRLIEMLWEQGINVYLPRLHPFSKGNLLFLAYTRSTSLQQNSLKIWEPKLDITQMIQPHQLDVVVTPLVAFDADGNRMGMGGGFYDRTLANWASRGKPYPIGFAHDCQQVSALPCEHWDVPLPMLITPSRVLNFEHCL